MAMIARMVEPQATVLELGVATGYLTQYLREAKGCDIDGVEIDPKVTEAGRRFFGLGDNPRLHVITADGPTPSRNR